MINNAIHNGWGVASDLFGRRRSGLALCICLCIAGCGDQSQMGEVSGQVLIDGKPAERGSVSFTPLSGGGPTAGSEIKDGKYSAMVFLGKNKVEIRVPRVLGKQKLYDTPDSPVQDILEESLPAKFNDQTALEIDVQKGKNPKNWEVSVKK